MKKRDLKKENTLLEKEQNRCVWMSAGVLSFKLCPYNLDCEHCEFDKVMRVHTRPNLKSNGKRHLPKPELRSERIPTSNLDSEESFFTFFVGEMDEKIHIHPAHLWARHEYDHTYKVGVDTLLAYILPPPLKIELFSPQEVFKEKEFGKIITEAGTVLITSPISGHLVQINPRLTENPELLQKDPWGEGWLATIEWSQDGSELERFYSGAAGKVFLQEEAQHLKFLLRHSGVEVSTVGITLPDGGANIQYLYQILPANVCLKLARELIVLGNIV